MILSCKHVGSVSIRDMFVRPFSRFKCDNFKNDLQERLTNVLPNNFFLYQKIGLIKYLTNLIAYELQQLKSVLFSKNFLESKRA